LLKPTVAAIGLFVCLAAELPAQDVALVNPKTIVVKLDNPRVRVMEATLAPGVKENTHSHPSSIVYVIAGGKVRNHLLDGTTSEVTYIAGETAYREPVTHWAENIGSTTIRLVVVELKPDVFPLQSAPIGGPGIPEPYIPPASGGTLRPLSSAAGSSNTNSNATADAAAVDAALRRYSSLVTNMDHSGISALFTSDGEISGPGQPTVRGRAAIDQMLSNFAGYQVVSNETTPTSTTVNGDAATQTGTFRESVRLPTGRVAEVSGNFTAEWQRQASGVWLIRRMATSLR
jgi:ketosteroid isomerase-like protein/quercetin dioxygenase-like cupin family protein